MANSLLAHLYSRIRGSQEDVATLSLHYLVSQSEPLNRAFTHLVSASIETPLADSLQYVCQATGEDGARPDMAGIDSAGKETILCEMKFYAGLTQNQPLGYIDRLKALGGTGLVFICPSARQPSLWAKLNEVCTERDCVSVSTYCISVDGIRLAVITWAEIIELLRKVAAASAAEFLPDIHQLDGFCSQMDSDAFIPFAPNELTAENARLGERFYEVLDRTFDLLINDGTLKTSKQGVKATAYRRGYTRSIYIDEFTVSLNYDRVLWKNAGSLETPFWVSIRENWKETERILNGHKKIPRIKKDTELWGVTFLALEPLTDATLDEVCQDLKHQILEYIQVFRN